MKRRRIGPAGRFVSWTARSRASFTSVWHCPRKSGHARRAAIAKGEDHITPEEAIKDPFVLEFLDLKDGYSETDLEGAIIQHLTDFLLELGDDFAFLGRQKSLGVDDTWFRVDLLSFIAAFGGLVVIDLKVGRFSYRDAGQMHLYLNYAREHWIKEGENPPVGLILCAEKGTGEAHYALGDLPNKILAAEYRIVLPDEMTIEEQLNSPALRMVRKLRRRDTAQRFHRNAACEEGPYSNCDSV